MTLFSRIERSYGMQIDRWMAVKDVYRVQTKRHGLLCVKPYRVPYEELEFIVRVQDHVAEQGFAWVPKTLPARDGEIAIGHRRTWYVVSHWVRGRHPSFQQTSQLARGVRTLAAFHRCAQGFSAESAPEKRVTDIGAEFRRQHRTLKHKYEGPHARLFVDLCEDALQQLGRSRVKRAIQAERQAGALVHGDYNYPNIVVDHQNRYQLIDFENTSLYVRMEDLAHIIHRNAPWQAEKTMGMIDAYDRVRPLSKEDLGLLIALLHQPYPIIRAIRSRKSTGSLQSVVPSKVRVESYIRQLKSIE
ncbi:phosphotransferase [Alicyclobacillus fastidiosus]|uniref:Phosphotransferase n=1 Tax=Alicyclobacillus fastidiosus TaxID=392011 RepID=A0ABV5AG47_9BACL|nr:phosphotransferase [Alicyclobacillus fastidiosus]WEH08887.1 phosphotransferase [Alicyclobacillus fastidiosus]